MERGIVHFDPFPKILFSPSVFSRLGFSSCLLLLHFDCRLPVFLVETWTASYFWARLWQRTAPRLPASHIFKKESYFQLFLYQVSGQWPKAANAYVTYSQASRRSDWCYQHHNHPPSPPPPYPPPLFPPPPPSPPPPPAASPIFRFVTEQTSASLSLR